MKIVSLFSLLMIIPTFAFGAGREDSTIVRAGANRGVRMNARVNIGSGISSAGDPIMMNAAGDPIMMTNNKSSGGGKRNVKKNSAGDTELQYDFSDFELDNSVIKQINATVSGKIVNGKVSLSDTEKKQIGDIVSAQVFNDKGVTKVNLSDDVKKQIGEIVSNQVIKEGGGLRFELSDLVKKQIGDLSLGLVEVKPIIGKPIEIKPGDLSSGDDCRDAYRECMDNFCLLDENQGERCACSDNINRAKSKLQEVLDIQAEADKLFSEGVEREQLGAKARLVFTEETAGNSKVSGKTFMSWLGGTDEDGEVGEDAEIGDELYSMAATYCESELKSCGDKAEMEEMLYTRMVAQDCKNYDAYLKDQKANAESNKRIAESAVRKARLEMLDTTNKYNRGECLLAYRSCIADKGGCGANFENCLDAKLLARRSNACENVLDQCMAVRDYVKSDWAEESKSVLAEAAKYADKNERATCLARVQDCLEDSCSTSTNSECLNNVNVAAGICPVITECDAKVPGFQAVVNDKLGYLRTKFCENDIDKCLQDKCGVDFSKPECVGKQPYEIVQLCPQTMFPACKNAEHYDTIVQSAVLQMDYQMLQGCVDYFAEKLTATCGADMKCLPNNAKVANLKTLPTTEDDLNKLSAEVIASTDASVEEFFKQLEQDKTVAACADSQSASKKKVKGKNSLGDSVFTTAKIIAKMSAENRSLRELDAKIAELTREKDVETARQTCLKTYKAEKPDESKSNYMYIKSVSFEPSLRNCHVCRMQQVCEEGGESKASAAMKGAGGGLAAGASVGTMANAGWGTAIGAAVGAVGGGVLGALSGGKKKFCQEVESCEDINM